MVNCKRTVMKGKRDTVDTNATGAIMGETWLIQGTGFIAEVTGVQAALKSECACAGEGEMVAKEPSSQRTQHGLSLSLSFSLPR
jgi:hypothetical protein